jgi:hypothetical protein
LLAMLANAAAPAFLTQTPLLAMLANAAAPAFLAPCPALAMRASGHSDTRDGCGKIQQLKRRKFLNRQERATQFGHRLDHLLLLNPSVSPPPPRLLLRLLLVFLLLKLRLWNDST